MSMPPATPAPRVNPAVPAGRPAAQPAPVPPPLPVPATRERPPLVRPSEGRIVAGVGAGLAAHLGLPVHVVRIGLVLTALTGGFGLALYIWLWAMVPSEDRHVEAAAADTSPQPHVARPGTGTVGSSESAAPGAAARGLVSSTRLGDVVVGALLLAGGLVVLGSQIGWQVPLGAVLPLIVVLGGAAMVYSQLDEVQDSRWAPDRPWRGRTLLRVAAGMALVLGGVLLAVVGSTDVAYAGRVLAAVAAMLGGAIVVLAPWGVRFWRDLDAERAAGAREAERADIAAHLHDSVLQTLALIQRNSDDSAQVMRLARAQERDLRSWLYGGSRSGGAGEGPLRLEQAVKQVAADVEDLHGVAVDVVVVGDRELDERGEALLAALREATVNAVRHAGAPVTVYAESGPDGVEAFVRDRGPGFDLDGVPADRHGVRQSIIARMDRHGGSAQLRSTSGEGVEVRLSMPDRAADGEPEMDVDEDGAMATPPDAPPDARTQPAPEATS